MAPDLILLSLVFMFANWYLLNLVDSRALIGIRKIITAKPANEAMPRYPNKKYKDRAIDKGLDLKVNLLI
jgi:hypothetical protein